MTTISIPPAALDAGKRELYPHLLTESDDMVREIARAAFVAMVEAWPDMAHRVMPYSALILPLPQEARDAER